MKSILSIFAVAMMAGSLRAMADYICYANLYEGDGQYQYSGCGPTTEGAAGSALNECDAHQVAGTACDELSTILNSCQTDTVSQPGYVCYSNLYEGDNASVVAGYGLTTQSAAGNALDNCDGLLRPGTACDALSVITTTCTATTLNGCEL